MVQGNDNVTGPLEEAPEAVESTMVTTPGSPASAQEATHEVTEEEFRQDVQIVRRASKALEKSSWDTAFKIGVIAAKYHEAAGGDTNLHSPRRHFSLRRLASKTSLSITLLRQCRRLYERFWVGAKETTAVLNVSQAVALLMAPPEETAALVREVEERSLSSREVAKIVRERYPQHARSGTKARERIIDVTAISSEGSTSSPAPASAADLEYDEMINGLQNFIAGMLNDQVLSSIGEAFVASPGFAQFEARIVDLFKVLRRFKGAVRTFRSE